jgi:S-DNA-T family DNA segregation ATPase FtsK/SpoIIIE
MELQPWAGCLDRLATTPDQAVALLRDALGEFDRRTGLTKAAGHRLWQPTPANPALIIVVDEYAELPDPAKTLADSVSRRGRAVAVNLLIATQRPTQKAMGEGAVRQQADVRICLRVREPRDADLILGQGATTAGWHAHTLNAPGKILISDPEHTTPRPARAYLINDRQVQHTAGRHGTGRPRLSAEPANGGPEPTTPDHSEPPAPPDRTANADAVLWRLLCDATENGATVADLVAATGMSRATVYRRLRGHAKAGRAVNLGGGRWRSLIVPASTHGSHKP